jgi:hypothetical protein
MLDLEEMRDKVVDNIKKDKMIPVNHLLFEHSSGELGIVDADANKIETGLNLASFDLHVSLKGIESYLAIYSVVVKKKEGNTMCIKITQFRKDGLHQYVMIPYSVQEDKEIIFAKDIWSEGLLAKDEKLEREDLDFELIYNMYEKKGLNELDDMNLSEKINGILLDRRNYKKVRNMMQEHRGRHNKPVMRDVENYLYKNEIHKMVKKRHLEVQAVTKEMK